NRSERTNEAARAKAAPQRRGPTLGAGPSAAQLAGAVENPFAATPADILALQQRYGNHAVQRLIQRENDEEQPLRPGLARFDQNTARGMWKYLQLMYHPDKGPEPWRTNFITKVNAAKDDLDELRRLKAEGERLSSQPSPEQSQALLTTG